MNTDRDNIVALDRGLYLHQIPLKQLSYPVCLHAMRVGRAVLATVPRKWRTYELCLLAVKNIGGDLREVPWKHRTLELCVAALQSNPAVDVEMSIPGKLLATCRAMVRIGG